MTIKTLLCCALLFSPLTPKKKSISITTTTTIEASAREVFNVLSDLSQYTQWSPFLVEDPNQLNRVEGTPGSIGSTFYWEGVDVKSLGQQELKEIKNLEYLKMECTILKPFKSEPIFEYFIEQEQDRVVVKQVFNLHLNGFNYFMTKLFGVEKHMIATNQLGLDRLKSYIESGDNNSKSESSLATENSK